MDEEAELAAQRLGQTVGGRWHLSRVLGVGGMAAVYAAHDDAGNLAAIKILHPEMSVRREVRERFLREGYVANRIGHPGVVQALEHGDAGDEAFLVMELLNGETLQARVKRHGKLPPGEVLDFTDQILDVLVSAHEKGVIHRDLKPDNLFVTAEGPIKILDFGLARLLDNVPGDHKTKSGVALGTLPYMAPEQALGRRSEIDGRVDVFAVGATMFRILSGRRVHLADSEAELLMAMASRPAPPLASVAPELPADLCAVVDLALAFSRDARYPDARTMQKDVRALARGARPPYATLRLSAREQATRVDDAVPAAPAAPQRVPQFTQPLAAMPMPRGATVPLQAYTGAAAGAPPSIIAHSATEDMPHSARPPQSARTEKLVVQQAADVASVPASGPGGTNVGYGVSAPTPAEKPKRSLLLVALVGVFFLMVGAVAAFVFLGEDATDDDTLQAASPAVETADAPATNAEAPSAARAESVSAAQPAATPAAAAARAKPEEPAPQKTPTTSSKPAAAKAGGATEPESTAAAPAAEPAKGAPTATGPNLLMTPPPAPVKSPPKKGKGKKKDN